MSDKDKIIREAERKGFQAAIEYLASTSMSGNTRMIAVEALVNAKNTIVPKILERRLVSDPISSLENLYITTINVYGLEAIFCLGDGTPYDGKPALFKSRLEVMLDLINNPME